MSQFKERYDIECPLCFHKMGVAPSIFHQMGAFDLGGGRCTGCNVLMRITYQPDNDTMVAEKFVAKDQGDCNTSSITA